MISEEIQYKYLNKIEESCKELSLSNYMIGNLIRSIHGSLPIILIVIIIFGTFNVVIITNIIITILLVCFILFRGCILSKLERKLCKDDFVITDPLFEILDIEINNENRFYTLYWIGIPYVILVNFIIYYRFYM